MTQCIILQLPPSLPSLPTSCPTVIHVMNAPRRPPFFAALPLPYIIVNANRKQNGGGLGMRLKALHVTVTVEVEENMGKVIHKWKLEIIIVTTA